MITAPPTCPGGVVPYFDQSVQRTTDDSALVELQGGDRSLVSLERPLHLIQGHVPHDDGAVPGPRHQNAVFELQTEHMIRVSSEVGGETRGHTRWSECESVWGEEDNEPLC